MLGNGEGFFFGLYLCALWIVVVFHAGRAKLTLAPLFLIIGIQVFLIWQLTQLGWWVKLGHWDVNAPLVSLTPAIMTGAALAYAMDGLRAGRACLSIVGITALLCIAFLEFVAALGEHVPLPSIFHLAIVPQAMLAAALLAGIAFTIVAFEAVRHALCVPLALAIAPAAGLAAFLIVFSLGTYGLDIGWRNLSLEYTHYALASLLPAVMLGVYGVIAQRARLLMPARQLSDVFALWRRTEHEMLDARGSMLRARETIVELQSLNQALETERRLRFHQVQNSPLAVIEVDALGCINSFNPAAERLLQPIGLLAEGLPVETVLPSFFSGLVPSGSASRILSVTQGPQKRQFQVMVMPIPYGRSGQGFSVLIEDVTDREQQAVKSQMKERIRGIGMAGRVIAHDFANIALGIEGNISRIRSLLEPAQGARVEGPLTAIHAAVERIRDMMLQFGSQQPFQAPRLETRVLGQLVNEAVQLQTPLALQQGVGLSGDLAPGLTVDIDAGQIMRVILNLIANALRATSAGGKVTVTLRRDGHGALMEVTDTGCGMNQEQLRKAFDPAFSTKSGGQGGLGLAISYLIVEAHGGTVRLNSEVGRGTQAAVWLPLAQAKPVPQAQRNLTVERLVLIVVPDDGLRTAFADQITAQGHDAIEVESFEELVALTQEDPRDWDLVVRALELELPTVLAERFDGLPQVLVPADPRRPMIVCNQHKFDPPIQIHDPRVNRRTGLGTA